MPELKGGSARVDLGAGYAIVAPGLRGRAERLAGGEPQTRAVELATPVLDAALAAAEMTSVATIEINARPVPGPAATDLRDPRGDEALMLEVPDLGAEAGQVVMSVDEAGTITWHFPLDGSGIQAPSERGAGGTKTFRIRSYVPSTPPSGSERSLVGAIGRKLLKVIVYPITDILIGKTAAQIAEHWEEKNRAYGLRNFVPANYTQPTAPALTAADVERLSQDRALLFLHGTFSTAHGAFGDMPSALVNQLHQRYGGRLFAFNHFSLSHAPDRNVQWLTDELRSLSPTSQLQVDIVCHSRGGLVARTLAEAGGVFGIDTSQAQVRRIVFVAAPNHGTLLAEPDHMVSMIDRLTSGLNLFPPSGIADVLEGILIAVKIIGHGALKGLTGLQSMNPKGQFLGKLNQGGVAGADYFAVAANYEPNDPGLRALVSGAIDGVVDRVFQNAENDLVVPESGVFEPNGSPSFPIAPNRVLRIPGTAGVMHTGLFGQPDVARKIGEWLQ